MSCILSNFALFLYRAHHVGDMGMASVRGVTHLERRLPHIISWLSDSWYRDLGSGTSDRTPRLFQFSFLAESWEW